MAVMLMLRQMLRCLLLSALLADAADFTPLRYAAAVTHAAADATPARCCHCYAYVVAACAMTLIAAYA